MAIYVDGVEVKLPQDFEEYLSLMRTACVKPGDPPIASNAEMVEKIIRDNYLSNIQQHAAVRPKAVAEKVRMLELQIMGVFDEAVQS